MLRPSRFGLGAALVAALALAPTARAAEPDKLIPADADTVVSINVKQLVDSEIVKKYAVEQIKQTLEGQDIRKYLRDMGLDPLKDIDRVVIAGSGKDQNDIKGIVVVRGKFDPEKLYKTAEAETKRKPDQFALVKDGKDVMFKWQPDNGNPVYGTVVDESTVIFGTDKKIITNALAAANGDKKPTINRQLASMITKMDDKASVWAVAIVKGKLDNAKLPGGGGAQNLQAQIPNLETVTAVIRVTGDINLEVTLGMKDEASADEMGKAVDEVLVQVKGFAPLLAANDPKMKPLAEAAKSLKSTVKDRNIIISAKVPGSAIGQLLNPDGE
ncbi:MAG TPA: hypothetical protein VKE40_25290 [Gemmataceae bacterium]|nr:hypothetical protein [Gemmataceae bacterium]